MDKTSTNKMKTSTKIGVGVGVATLGFGAIAASILPIAGLIAGAYYAAGAASATAMSTPAAALVLGAAGALGGFVVGRIAAVAVAGLSAVLAVGGGALAGAFSSLFEKNKKPDQSASTGPASINKPQIDFSSSKLDFDANAQKPAAPKNDNAAPAQEQKKKLDL